MLTVGKGEQAITHRTAVAYNTGNPVWQHEELYLQNVPPGCPLRIEVWDKDHFTADDYVGSNKPELTVEVLKQVWGRQAVERRRGLVWCGGQLCLGRFGGTAGRAAQAQACGGRFPFHLRLALSKGSPAGYNLFSLSNFSCLLFLNLPPFHLLPRCLLALQGRPSTMLDDPDQCVPPTPSFACHVQGRPTH